MLLLIFDRLGTYMSIRSLSHTRTNTGTRARTHTHTHTSMHACMHAQVHVHIHTQGRKSHFKVKERDIKERNYLFNDNSIISLKVNLFIFL